LRVLSLINQKGGCGKTTTAVHLAGALAGRGSRVLLVDLDPQAHATLSLGISVVDEPSVAEVMLGEVEPLAAVRRAPGGIDLLPATERLAEVEEVAARLVGPERLLARALGALAPRYDHVLVDGSPRADGVLAGNALRASDTVLLVVETGTYALQGAHKAMRLLARLAAEVGRPLDARPHDVRVVATLFDPRSRIAREVLVGAYARFGGRLLNTVVRTSERLREAAACGLPIQVLDPESAEARDFDELARELTGAPAERTSPAYRASPGYRGSHEHRAPAHEAPAPHVAHPPPRLETTR